MGGEPLQLIDIILRAGGGFFMVVLALVLLVQSPRERIFRQFLTMSFGTAEFLAINMPDIGLQLSGVSGVLAAALSGNAAVSPVVVLPLRL